MTGQTLCWDRLVFHNRHATLELLHKFIGLESVAVFTTHLLVLALKRVFGLSLVIELWQFPLLFGVAFLTIGTQLSLMHIFMAGQTLVLL